RWPSCSRRPTSATFPPRATSPRQRETMEQLLEAPPIPARRASEGIAHPSLVPGPAPIRVCFMIDELTPAGTETQLVALIRNLNRARVRPYLCLLRQSSAPSRLLERTNCPVYHVGLRSFSRFSTLAKAWRLGRFFRRERIDGLQRDFSQGRDFGVLVVPLVGG